MWNVLEYSLDVIRMMGCPVYTRNVSRISNRIRFVENGAVVFKQPQCGFWRHFDEVCNRNYCRALMFNQSHVTEYAI